MASFSFLQRDSIDRYVVLCLIVFVWFDQVQTIGDKKQLEDIEEAHEEQKEKELEKRNNSNKQTSQIDIFLFSVYSSSKANTFLSYDKCIQRLKCPASRKEECSEECRAGNTEEEMEEHEELVHDEHRSSLSKAPKQKFESLATPKKSRKQSPNTKTDL